MENEKKISKLTEKEIENLDESIKILSGTMKTGEPENVKNPVLGDVEIRLGNRNECIAHIIYRRVNERMLRTENTLSREEALLQTTAILMSVVNSVKSGIAYQDVNGNYCAEEHGIKAIISKDKYGKYVLTGFDMRTKKEEATEFITSVSEYYDHTPEFLGIYAQAGAVYTSLENIISQTKKVSILNSKITVYNFQEVLQKAAEENPEKPLEEIEDKLFLRMRKSEKEKYNRILERKGISKENKKEFLEKLIDNEANLINANSLKTIQMDIRPMQNKTEENKMQKQNYYTKLKGFVANSDSSLGRVEIAVDRDNGTITVEQNGEQPIMPGAEMNWNGFSLVDFEHQDENTRYHKYTAELNERTAAFAEEIRMKALNNINPGDYEATTEYPESEALSKASWVWTHYQDGSGGFSNPKNPSQYDISYDATTNEGWLKDKNRNETDFFYRTGYDDEGVEIFDLEKFKAVAEEKIANLLNINIEQENAMEKQNEQTPAQKTATNFVLDKLAQAGIEVITDKAEMREILNSGKLVQKMAAYHGTSHEGEIDNAFNGFGTYVVSVNTDVAKEQGMKIASKKYGDAFYIKSNGQEQTLDKFLSEHGYSSYWNELLKQTHFDDVAKLQHEIMATDSKGNTELEGQKTNLSVLLSAGVIEYKREKTYLYSIDIPDNNGKNYLFYEKSIGLDAANNINAALEKMGVEWRVDRRDAGRQVYFNTLSEKVFNGNQEQTSKFLKDIGYAGMEMNSSNYIVFDEKDIVVNKRVQYMMDENGEVYGFTQDGKIYLDPDLMNSNTPVHEYTHIWDAYTQRTNPELWEKGKAILQQTHLWQEVVNDPNYSEIADDEDLVLSEVHSRICGAMAEKVLERIAAQDGEIAKDRAIDWEKETWDYIKENLYDEIWKNKDYPLSTQQEFEGIKYFRKDEPSLDTQLMFSELKDFLAMPMQDFMNGKKITQEIAQEQPIEKMVKQSDVDVGNTFTDTLRESDKAIEEATNGMGHDPTDGLPPEFEPPMDNTEMEMKGGTGKEEFEIAEPESQVELIIPDSIRVAIYESEATQAIKAEYGDSYIMKSQEIYANEICSALEKFSQENSADWNIEAHDKTAIYHLMAVAEIGSVSRKESAEKIKEYFSTDIYASEKEQLGKMFAKIIETKTNNGYGFNFSTKQKEIKVSEKEQIVDEKAQKAMAMKETLEKMGIKDGKVPEFAMLTQNGLKAYKDMSISEWNPKDQTFTLAKYEDGVAVEKAVVTARTLKELVSQSRIEMAQTFNENTSIYEKMLAKQYTDFFEVRENTANNFRHNFAVNCRQTLSTPVDAIKTASELIKKMPVEERRKVKELLNGLGEKGQPVNEKLVNMYKEALKDVPPNEHYLAQKRALETTRYVPKMFDTVTANGQQVDKGFNLKIGDTINNVSFKVDKIFDTGKEKLLMDCKIVSATKEGNSVTLVDAAGGYHDVPRDMFLKQYAKQQKQEHKQDRHQKNIMRLDIER